MSISQAGMVNNSAIIFMRRSEYYTAPLFLTSMLLGFVISLLMALGRVSLPRRQCRGDFFTC